MRRRTTRTTNRVLAIGVLAALALPVVAVGAPANALTGGGQVHAPAASGSWPSFRFDLSNSGFNRYEAILSPSNVSGLVEKWSLRRYHVTDVSDIVADGFVFTAGRRNLFAIDIETGKWVWHYRGDFENVPTVANGVIYAAGQLGFTALDAHTGSVLWNDPTVYTFRSAPAVSDGIVYVGAYDNLYAIDASTGATIWTFPTHGPVFSSPAVVHGWVYFGTDKGTLYAVDAATGKERWQYDFPSGHQRYRRISSPAVAGGMVFASFAGAQIFALDVQTGKPVWHVGMPLDPHVASPAVANGVVYEVVPGDGTIRALDAATGSERWRANVYRYSESPAVANGVVYVGAEAFRASDGAELWNGGCNCYSSVVSNGRLYVTIDYFTYAYGL